MKSSCEVFFGVMVKLSPLVSRLRFVYVSWCLDMLYGYVNPFVPDLGIDPLLIRSSFPFFEISFSSFGMCCLLVVVKSFLYMLFRCPCGVFSISFLRGNCLKCFYVSSVFMLFSLFAASYSFFEQSHLHSFHHPLRVLGFGFGIGVFDVQTSRYNFFVPAA